MTTVGQGLAPAAKKQKVLSPKKNNEDFLIWLNMIDKKFKLCYKYMARGEMAERLNAHDSKSCYG